MTTIDLGLKISSRKRSKLLHQPALKLKKKILEIEYPPQNLTPRTKFLLNKASEPKIVNTDFRDILRKAPPLPTKTTTIREGDKTEEDLLEGRRKTQKTETEEERSSISIPIQKEWKSGLNDHTEFKQTKFLIKKFRNIENSTEAETNLKISGGKIEEPMRCTAKFTQ